MNIERQYYQERKKNEWNIEQLEDEWNNIILSPQEIDMGRKAFEQAISMSNLFEQEHPRIKSPERIQQFEQLAQAALLLAETMELDISVKISSNLIGHLTLTGDILLLRRDYALNFLPLMKKMMDMCDEFLINTVEKYGETLINISVDIPLYVRGLSI